MKAFVERIGMDKIAHFGVGGLITALLTVACVLQDLDILAIAPWRAVLYPIIGSVVTAFVSVLKELLMDSKADWLDLGYAMLGSVAVFVASFAGVLMYLWSN